MSSTRTPSALTARHRRRGSSFAVHSLPVCPATGEPRHRDRHQARQAADAIQRSSKGLRCSPWACTDCKGFHLATTFRAMTKATPTLALAPLFLPGVRRLVLIDLLNATHGTPTAESFTELEDHLSSSLGITGSDHLVVGSPRSAMRRLRRLGDEARMKWVVAADRPDAVVHALSAATDLWASAREYDELVIVSGNGAFTELASRAARFGIPVRVVTTRTPVQPVTLSRDLATVATTRTVLDLQHAA